MTPGVSTRALRVVLDTNVVVSALLHRGRVPDQALARVRERGDVVLHDARIEAEYRAVLARPKFRAIPPDEAEVLLAALLSGARTPTVPWLGVTPDPDDRMFVEVALAGRADVLVTGNARHFPSGLGFEVLSPAAYLARVLASATGP